MKTIQNLQLAEKTDNEMSTEFPVCTKKRVHRMLIIAGTLEMGITLTAKSISKGFGISLRTAYRDIDEVIAVGIPVIRTEGGFTIDPDRRSAWLRTVSEAWVCREANSPD